jgi:hypothetical protein
MELLSIRTARLLAFFPTDEINPRGRSIIHDVFPAFVERYKFIKFPQKAEEFDETNGVRFENGTWNGLDTTIVIYNNGIMVDTRSSTDDSEKVLEDALKWAADTFGLTYQPEMLARKAYLSELDVKCDIPLEALNPKLEAFVNKLTQTVSGLTGQSLNFKASALWINFDSAFAKGPASPFRFERLVEIPFAENKYYAGAPLPTKTHLEFLEELEAVLKS